MNILELRLASTDAGANAVKVLRRFFPQTSISELRQIVKQGQPIFSCRSGDLDGKKAMMRMVKSLRAGGMAVSLCERAGGKTYPLEVKQLQAFINRGRAAGRQVLDDIENEAEE